MARELRTPSQVRCRKFAAVAAAAVGVVLWNGRVTLAADATWQNVGSTWTTNTNWSDAHPKGSGETATFGAAAAGEIVQPTLDSDLTIGALSINNTLGSYDLNQSGSRVLTLANISAALTITGGGTTTIAPEIRIGANKTFSTDSTNLTLAGGLGLLNGPSTLTLTNVSPVTVAGLITSRDAVNGVLTMAGSGSMNVTGNIARTTGMGSISLGSTATYTGTLTLAGNNGFGATTNWGAGTLVLASDSALGGQILNIGSSSGGSRAVSVLAVAGVTNSRNIGFAMGGQANPSYTIGGSSPSGVATYNGAVVLNSYTNAAAIQLTAATGGTVVFNGNIGGGTGTVKFNKIDGGTVVLAGTNTYTGSTTISEGTLQFAKTLAFYNNTNSSWSAANFIVQSGATAAFNVGGTGEFNSSASLDKIVGLGTSQGGFRSGSTIAFDTTNATSGFGYGGPIANTNSGNNVLSLKKLGANMLTLGGANTYTGDTTVSTGTLSITGSIANNGSAKVFIATDPTGTFGTSDDVALIRKSVLNASYAGIGSTEVGGLGTAANLKLGRNASNNAAGETISMKWRARAAGETPGTQASPPIAAGNPGLYSDVLSLTGMANAGVSGSGTTDAYVLEMSYVDTGFSASGANSEALLAAGKGIVLGWLNPDGAGAGIPLWGMATLGNSMTGSLTNAFTTNYQGSFDAFLAAHPGLTDATVANYLGSYGVDIATNTAWAVVNHNSQFAVIPEPTAISFLGIGGASLLIGRRRFRAELTTDSRTRPDFLGQFLPCN